MERPLGKPGTNPCGNCGETARPRENTAAGNVSGCGATVQSWRARRAHGLFAGCRNQHLMPVLGNVDASQNTGICSMLNLGHSWSPLWCASQNHHRDLRPGHGRPLRNFEAAQAAMTFIKRVVPNMLWPRIHQWLAVGMGRETRGYHPSYPTRPTPAECVYRAPQPHSPARMARPIHHRYHRRGSDLRLDIGLEFQQRPPEHPLHGLQTNHCRTTGHRRHRGRPETENGRVSSMNVPRQKKLRG